MSRHEGRGHENEGLGGRQGRRDRRGETRERDSSTTKPKAVFALTEREDRTFWTRIGVAFVNSDGSITARLDALPTSGQLQIRDDEPREAREQS
jgi:hypothetical protein